MKSSRWRLAAVSFFTLASASLPSAAAEQRCGWIENPTPGNWWLTDADGQWIMGTQGAAQADGMDLLPDFTTHDFVATNGDYGYACACLDGTFGQQRVTAIKSVKQLPLSTCRGDARLPKP